MNIAPAESVPQAVLLIAHGSREEAANREVIEMAERLGSHLPGVPVIPCFLDVVQPGIPAGFHQAVATGARRITAVPFSLLPERMWAKISPGFSMSAVLNARGWKSRSQRQSVPTRGWMRSPCAGSTDRSSEFIRLLTRTSNLIRRSDTQRMNSLLLGGGDDGETCHVSD